MFLPAMRASSLRRREKAGGPFYAFQGKVQSRFGGQTAQVCLQIGAAILEGLTYDGARKQGGPVQPCVPDPFPIRRLEYPKTNKPRNGWSCFWVFSPSVPTINNAHRVDGSYKQPEARVPMKSSFEARSESYRLQQCIHLSFLCERAVRCVTHRRKAIDGRNFSVSGRFVR